MRHWKYSLIACGLACAASAHAERAYVPNEGDGTVSVIELDAKGEAQQSRLLNPQKIGDKIQGVETSTDGKRLFVVDAQRNTITVMDTATGEVVKTITAGNGPEGIDRSPDGKTLAV